MIDRSTTSGGHENENLKVSILKKLKPNSHKSKAFKKSKRDSGLRGNADNRSDQKSTASSRAGEAPFNCKGSVLKGKEVKLTGINMSEPLYISICREDGGMRESKPIELDLTLLQAGKSIPAISGNLEDEVHFKVNGVSLRNSSKRLNIFSPYWIVNKTGMSMSYLVSGSSVPVHDTSLGRLPVLVDAKDNYVDGNWISCIPNQGVFLEELNEWWNSDKNGDLSCRSPLLTTQGRKAVDYSEKIGLDNVGQVGEISCGNVSFGVTVETMTGVFNASNMMTFYPRFVLRNEHSVDVEVVAVKARSALLVSNVDKDWEDGRFASDVVVVKPGKALALYTFVEVSYSSVNVHMPERCVLRFALSN